MPFDGVLFDPSTRDSVKVSVRAAGSWLEVSGAGEIFRVDASRCSLTAGGWNRESVQIAWPGPGGMWALSSKEPHLRAELAQVPAFRTALDEIHRVQTATQRRGRLGLTLVATLTLLPVLFLVGLVLFRNRIVDFVLERIPITVDQEIGRRFEAEIRGSPKTLAEGETVRALSVIVDRLGEAIPNKRFEFRVWIQKDKDVNAFATPGGLIVVTTGLIETAGSAEEAAGVLAHEMAHGEERHSMRQLIYASGLLPLMGALIGPADGALLFQNLGRLFELKFSRTQEEEADRAGFDALRAASISTEGMAAFFDRLAGLEGTPPSFLSTHPSSADRANALRDRARVLGGSAVKPLAIDWKAVKASMVSARAERP